jgi:hypothetical protein
LSNFQDELRNDDGYEDVVIIAVGQSNISNFNSNFCSNSDLPLVMDQYPGLPIRDQFSPYGLHKQIVILDQEGNFIGSLILNSGLSVGAKSYIRNLIEDNYQEESLLGDINEDTLINIQDIILLINIILNEQDNNLADMNADGLINVLDVVLIVNIILN